MASYSLLYVGRQYLIDHDGFLRTFTSPWIVWAPPKRRDMIMATACNAKLGGDTDEPVAMEIVKGPKSVFAFGITLGHSENNDLVLRHDSVSRFHAYFQNQGGKLSLVDADSRNGTFVDGTRLTPSKPHPLPPSAKLVFGELEVRFFMPEQMAAFLEAQSLGG